MVESLSTGTEPKIMSKNSQKPLPQEPVPLADLLLDSNNPRFGQQDGSNSEQEQILKQIVSAFEVDDILSSLAVNGYFQSEPLICQKGPDDKYIVKEGNRRLAACLILDGDKRAAGHEKRAARFKKIWEEHGEKPIREIPAIIFPSDKNKEVLSYLGVRHISSTMPWDSYAKATWIARVVKENNLKVSEIARMVGDQHKTISRMLEGYYFVQQMIKEGKFDLEDSARRGRGSMPNFPFSWVYATIQRKAVRKYLGMDAEEPVEDPIPRDRLDNGGFFLKSLFGNKSQGRNSSISDSRQLGDLAEVFGDPEKVALLKDGKSVQEIKELMQPIKEQLSEGLVRVKEIQTILLSRLVQRGIPQSDAESLESPAKENRNLAEHLHKNIKERAVGREEEH